MALFLHSHWHHTVITIKQPRTLQQAYHCHLSYRRPIAQRHHPLILPAEPSQRWNAKTKRQVRFLTPLYQCKDLRAQMFYEHNAWNKSTKWISRRKTVHWVTFFWSGFSTWKSPCIFDSSLTFWVFGSAEDYSTFALACVVGTERQSKGGRAGEGGSPRRESRTRGKGKGCVSPFSTCLPRSIYGYVLFSKTDGLSLRSWCLF